MTFYKFLRLNKILSLLLLFLVSSPFNAFSSSSDSDELPENTNRRPRERSTPLSSPDKNDSESSDNQKEAFKPSALKKPMLTEDTSKEFHLLDESALLNAATSSAVPQASPSLAESPEIVQSSAPTSSPPKLKNSPSPEEEKMDVSPSLSIVKEIFYIFNVGQGNSQLAIYDEGGENPFGVLYDCGSSAQTVSEKILKTRFSNASFKSFITLKTTSNKKPASPDVSDSDSDDLSGSDGPVSVGSSITMETQTLGKGELEETALPNIKEVIRKHKLKRLYVFLSHSDKDHINLFQENIPDNIIVSLILSGNFFIPSETEAEDASSSIAKKYNLKTDVQRLFSYIQSNKNIHVILPYHWDDKDYTKIKDFVQLGTALNEKIQASLSR